VEYLELGAEGEQGYPLVGMTEDVADRVRHNWTEIILAFTFTITVVLIFIL